LLYLDLALRFCSSEQLDVFRDDLLGYTRKHSTSAVEYNSQFRAKLAMVAAFGSARQIDKLQLIKTYQENSRLGLPTEVLNHSTGQPERYTSLDHIMAYGEAKYSELQSATSAQVHTLRPGKSISRQGHKQGHRQSTPSQQQGQQQGQQGGSQQHAVAALQAQVDQLKATVAAFQAPARGKRQGNHQQQQGSSYKHPVEKRTRFATPPPAHRNRSPERPSYRASDTRMPYCTWCKTNTHDTSACRCLHRMEANGKLPQHFRHSRR
jgi:hypothetical protein